MRMNNKSNLDQGSKLYLRKKVMEKLASTSCLMEKNSVGNSFFLTLLLIFQKFFATVFPILLLLKPFILPSFNLSGLILYSRNVEECRAVLLITFIINLLMILIPFADLQKCSFGKKATWLMVPYYYMCPLLLFLNADPFRI